MEYQEKISKILHHMISLDDPQPPGHEKLTGQERYRVRQVQYRIVYSIQDKEVTVRIVESWTEKRCLSMMRSEAIALQVKVWQNNVA